MENETVNKTRSVDRLKINIFRTVMVISQKVVYHRKYGYVCAYLSSWNFQGKYTYTGCPSLGWKAGISTNKNRLTIPYIVAILWPQFWFNKNTFNKSYSREGGGAENVKNDRIPAVEVNAAPLRFNWHQLVEFMNTSNKPACFEVWYTSQVIDLRLLNQNFRSNLSYLHMYSPCGWNEAKKWLIKWPIFECDTSLDVDLRVLNSNFRLVINTASSINFKFG